VSVDQTTRQVVNRYDLEDGVILTMPAGSLLLSVAWFEGGCRLWALTDPHLPKVQRRVWMKSTGHELIGDNWGFAGTIIAPGKRVWHVFLSLG
jgi:hypothetical protein